LANPHKLSEEQTSLLRHRRFLEQYVFVTPALLEICRLIFSHSRDSQAHPPRRVELEEFRQIRQSLERGSIEQLFGSITKSHTRALAAMGSSSRLESMKAIHSLNRLLPQEASGHSTTPAPSTRWHIRRRDSLPLREAIPLWFAISSPLIGLIIGFLGAWFVNWLTS
jgi:hypothetical protein